MSAPDTNVERQAKNHKFPLWGMAAVVAFALALLFALTVYLADIGGTPDGAEEQVDGRTGEITVTE